MKPLYTKKNGTSQRVAAVEVKMPASYPASRVTHESVSVTADGVKTYSALLDELFALADFSKISIESRLTWGTQIYCLVDINNSRYIYTRCYFNMSNGKSSDWQIHLQTSGSMFVQQQGENNTTNYSLNTASSGEKFTLYY